MQTEAPINTRNVEFRDPPEQKFTRGAVQDFINSIAWKRGEWAVYRSNVNRGTAYASVAKYRKRYPHTQWRAVKEGENYTIFAKVIYV